MKKDSPLSDEVLIQQFQSGDRNALGTLFQRHRQMIHAIVFKTTRDRALTDDILQDTFLRATISLDAKSYQHLGNIRGWMLRIARNLCMDFYRAQKRCPIMTRVHTGNENIESDDYLRSLEWLADVSALPDEKLISAETKREIRALIETLPPQLEQVVRLRYHQRLSFREIAEHTGTGINTALGRMRYAILYLRQQVLVA